MVVDYLKFCHWLKKTLFYVTRYPCFYHDEIIKNIVPQASSQQELDEYLELSNKRSRLSVIFFMMTYLIYVMKVSHYLIFTMSNVDLNNVESNIERIDENLFKFTCVLTNCTQLSSNSTLAEDMIQLPIFSICHPEISKQYPPVINLDSLGVLIFLICCLYILWMGFILPLQQNVYPINNESIMYVLAPNVQIKILIDRIKILMRDISISFQNYKTKFKKFTLQNQSPVDLDVYKIDEQLRSSRSNAFSPPVRGGLCWRQKMRSIGLQRNQIIKDDGPRFTDDELEEFAKDCLPAVRSSWWWTRVTKNFCFSLMMLLNVASLIAFFIFAMILLYLNKKKTLLQNYATMMNQTGCAIWKLPTTTNATNDEMSKSFVDLNDIRLDWSVYSIIETFFIYLGPTFTLAAVLTYYYQASCELMCWLIELHNHAMLAIEFMRFQDLLSPTHEDYPGKKLVMNEIRRRLLERTRFKFMILVSDSLKRQHTKKTNSRLDVKIANQEYALDLIVNQRSSPDSHVEIVEKFYISLRLFIGLVGHYSRSLVVLFVLANILNYGLAMVAVYLGRRISTFRTEALCLVMFVMVNLTIGISVASNVHAQVSTQHRALP